MYLLSGVQLLSDKEAWKMALPAEIFIGLLLLHVVWAAAWAARGRRFFGLGFWCRLAGEDVPQWDEEPEGGWSGNWAKVKAALKPRLAGAAALLVITLGIIIFFTLPGPAKRTTEDASAGLSLLSEDPLEIDDSAETSAPDYLRKVFAAMERNKRKNDVNRKACAHIAGKAEQMYGVPLRLGPDQAVVEAMLAFAPNTGVALLAGAVGFGHADCYEALWHLVLKHAAQWQQPRNWLIDGLITELVKHQVPHMIGVRMAKKTASWQAQLDGLVALAHFANAQGSQALYDILEPAHGEPLLPDLMGRARGDSDWTPVTLQGCKVVKALAESDDEMAVRLAYRGVGEAVRALDARDVRAECLEAVTAFAGDDEGDDHVDRKNFLLNQEVCTGASRSMQAGCKTKAMEDCTVPCYAKPAIVQFLDPAERVTGFGHAVPHPHALGADEHGRKEKGILYVWEQTDAGRACAALDRAIDSAHDLDLLNRADLEVDDFAGERVLARRIAQVTLLATEARQGIQPVDRMACLRTVHRLISGARPWHDLVHAMQAGLDAPPAPLNMRRTTAAILIDAGGDSPANKQLVCKVLRTLAGVPTPWHWNVRSTSSEAIRVAVQEQCTLSQLA